MPSRLRSRRGPHGRHIGERFRPAVVRHSCPNRRGRDRARFYDFAEACRIARRDGWGTNDGQQPGETARQYAARAARADFEVLKAWCADEWRFVGVCLSVEREGVALTAQYAHALWGVECNYPGSDNSYLSDVAGQLLPEALDDARAILARLAA